MKNLKTLTTVFVSASLLAGSAYAQENPKLSDPEVAHVAVVANQIDIAYAAIAKEKSKDADILKFAETMTNDHNAVITQASALVKKLNVTPKENSVSQKLLADAEQTKKSLRAKSGKEFNKAYIDNEVAYHKTVNSALSTTLIPDAQNSELKSLLQNGLKVFEDASGARGASGSATALSES